MKRSICSCRRRTFSLCEKSMIYPLSTRRRMIAGPIPMPVRPAAVPCAPPPARGAAAVCHALGFARNLQRRQIQSAETAELDGGEVIAHAEIRQIDEGMAQGR